jgi:hypothetical protein
MGNKLEVYGRIIGSSWVGYKPGIRPHPSGIWKHSRLKERIYKILI